MHFLDMRVKLTIRTGYSNTRDIDVLGALSKQNDKSDTVFAPSFHQVRDPKDVLGLIIPSLLDYGSRVTEKSHATGYRAYSSHRLVNVRLIDAAI
jgi:hypothetical protein